MIKYKTGNIFDADCEAIVNTVNCVGVMGRGLALQFKKRFPENYTAYKKACKRKEVKLGKMFVYHTDNILNPKYIINFPTKDHWRNDSCVADIETGLEALTKFIREENISSIAIPPLGCGLGGLNWKLVRNKMEIAFGPLNNVLINIYQPHDVVSAKKIFPSSKVPAMTPGRAALLGLMQRYLAGLLNPFITLLEIHKLLYFLQVSGEKLRLNYVKAPYGPYAENLCHVLNAIEGHFVFGYADGGDMPNKCLNIIPGAEKDAESFLKKYPDTRHRMQQIADLVDGYETPKGLELLATVHWIVQNEDVKSIQDIIKHTYKWGKHKKQFNSRQIELAFSRLEQKGWINTQRKIYEVIYAP